MPQSDMSNEQQQMFEAAIAAAPPYPAERFAGRGIVICAGGARLFTCAWVAIGILRRVLGCRLPIQLWHLGPEEIGPPMQALLEELDVEVVDALELAERYPLRIVGGWELKSYAIVHSRFREVFLLDADNVPLIDPASLFELAAIRRRRRDFLARCGKAARRQSDLADLRRCLSQHALDRIGPAAGG